MLLRSYVASIHSTYAKQYLVHTVPEVRTYCSDGFGNFHVALEMSITITWSGSCDFGRKPKTDRWNSNGLIWSFNFRFRLNQYSENLGKDDSMTVLVSRQRLEMESLRRFYQ